MRDGLSRVNLFEGSIEEAAGSYGQDGFDGYNLSDLFEYMSETDGLQLHAELLQYARPAARIAYWNMMVPRRFAHGTQSGIMELRELADSLHAGDQGFFYQDFVLEETAS